MLRGLCATKEWASLLATSLLAVLAVAGCTSHDDALVTNGLPDLNSRHDAKLVLDDAREGREHFSHGRYGLAQHHFRKAIQDQPGNVGAWMGLAASYDQLGRFDLAERAYHQAMKLGGRSAEILNNLGYHYMLRGQYARARKNFEAAALLAPNDGRIRTNLAVLETGAMSAGNR